MNTYESEKRNPKCVLRGYDDPLFDQAETSAFSTDSSALPEPAMVMEDAEKEMMCDCCGCYEGDE
jgi:hypothetical protein